MLATIRLSMKPSSATWSSFSLEMDVSSLKAKNDSQLVVNQFTREYQVKKPHVIKYLKKYMT